MAGKSSLKDKLEDEELDLSMMQLQDIPVKDIELLGQKVITINLSHNLLTSMPANFPLLSYITKLDLSKNSLIELPENFGGFKSLKSLDLYANRLEKLPVSFAQLKHLKWLDLKDNPLCPALKQAAGDCITPNDCALCAKKVVALLQSMESQLQRERQRRMEEEVRVAREAERREEAERERVRQDKRLAKEKRREEARVREAEGRKDTEVKGRQDAHTNGNGVAQRTEMNGSSRGGELGVGGEGRERRGCLGTIMLFLLGLGVVGLGLLASLVWVYTEGRLDSQSVATALPHIRADVQEWVGEVWSRVEEKAGPVAESTLKSSRKMWREGGKQIRKWAKYAEQEYGPSLGGLWASCTSLVGAAVKVVEPLLSRAWEASKPFFHQLGKGIIEASLEAGAYLQATFPQYCAWCQDKGASIVQVAASSWQKVVEAF